MGLIQNGYGRMVVMITLYLLMPMIIHTVFFITLISTFLRDCNVCHMIPVRRGLNLNTINMLSGDGGGDS